MQVIQLDLFKPTPTDKIDEFVFLLNCQITAYKYLYLLTDQFRGSKECLEILPKLIRLSGRLGYLLAPDSIRYKTKSNSWWSDRIALKELYSPLETFSPTDLYNLSKDLQVGSNSLLLRFKAIQPFITRLAPTFMDQITDLNTKVYKIYKDEELKFQTYG